MKYDIIKCTYQAAAYGVNGGQEITSDLLKGYIRKTMVEEDDYVTNRYADEWR